MVFIRIYLWFRLVLTQSLDACERNGVFGSLLRDQGIANLEFWKPAKVPVDCP
jgi:hypothetical protein